jgi:hypothetical protein
LATLGEIKTALDLLALLQKQWYSHWTVVVIDLVLGYFMLSPLYASIAWGSLNPMEKVLSAGSLSKAIPVAIVIVIFTIAWILSIRPKCIKKDRIGLVIAIKAENEVEYIRIKNDFIKTVTSLLGAADKRISVLALNEYHATQLLKGTEHLEYYHKRTNSRLLIYGSCCTRQQEGKPYYYLSINSSVSHMRIPIQLSNRIRRQMLEVLPTGNLIAVDSELVGFQLMSDYFRLVAMYILGISAHVSRDPELALTFHEPLYRQLAATSKSIELVKILRSRCRRQVIAECIELAQIAYKTEKDVERMHYFANKVLELGPENWQAHLPEGIYLFISKRDVQGAIRESKLARNSIDYIWLLNVAFLDAYCGDLDSAYHAYRSAFEKAITPDAHLQTEEFMRQILKDEPSKIQLYYCLGLIYYLFRHDLVLAKEAFISFKQKAFGTEYEKWIEYTNKYLSEIETSK